MTFPAAAKAGFIEADFGADPLPGWRVTVLQALRRVAAEARGRLASEAGNQAMRRSPLWKWWCIMLSERPMFCARSNHGMACSGAR